MYDASYGNRATDLANTGTIISRESTCHSIGSRANFSKAHAIYIFCFRSKARNGQDLLVFSYALM
jgi:hypothetical protein